MASNSEHHSAARQFYAEVEPSRSARELCEEGDDPEALAMEAWAAEMVKRGMPRRQALQAAAAIWELQRAKDAACARSAVVWAGEVPERAELLRGLREIGARIYEAKKRGMEAGALVLATGSVHGDFQSARELAERQGVSHEHAANAEEAWRTLFNLPPRNGLKSEEAKRVYQDTNGKMGRKAA